MLKLRGNSYLRWQLGRGVGVWAGCGGERRKHVISRQGWDPHAARMSMKSKNDQYAVVPAHLIKCPGSSFCAAFVSFRYFRYRASSFEKRLKFSSSSGTSPSEYWAPIDLLSRASWPSTFITPGKLRFSPLDLPNYRAPIRN